MTSSLEWLGQAACGTPDGSVNPLFDIQPTRGSSPEIKSQIRRQTAAAKEICNGKSVVTLNDDGVAVVKFSPRPCPIRERCLELAMANETTSVGTPVDHGDRAMIFGGLTPRERFDLARTRSAEAGADAPRSGARGARLAPVVSLEKHCATKEPKLSKRQYFDPTKVDRRMAGERKMKLTTAERHELIRRAHALGLNDVEIERRFDVAARQVVRDRKAMGLPAAEGWAPVTADAREERRARVAEMHAAGRSDQHISYALGVTEWTVRDDRRSLGLPVLFGPGGRRINRKDAA